MANIDKLTPDGEVYTLYTGPSMVTDISHLLRVKNGVLQSARVSHYDEKDSEWEWFDVQVVDDE